MHRRTFLQTLGVTASLALSSRADRLYATESTAAMPDLVAVKNGEPEALFDRGIEAMGGMRRFVKKGQTVVVKPNIGWNAPPERAANTNPRLVRRIIEHCLQAGA